MFFQVFAWENTALYVSADLARRNTHKPPLPRSGENVNKCRQQKTTAGCFFYDFAE